MSTRGSSHVVFSERGLDSLIDGLSELCDEGPSPSTVAALDGVLSAMFADTQARTHVLTGRLKASGHMFSSVDRTTGTWVGEITYGGPGVSQAVYEMAEGGTHDFLRGLPAFDDDLTSAIEQEFR